MILGITFRVITNILLPSFIIILTRMYSLQPLFFGFGNLSARIKSRYSHGFY
jgi:hypothetical protein